MCRAGLAHVPRNFYWGELTVSPLRPSGQVAVQQLRHARAANMAQRLQVAQSAGGTVCRKRALVWRLAAQRSSAVWQLLQWHGLQTASLAARERLLHHATAGVKPCRFAKEVTPALLYVYGLSLLQADQARSRFEVACSRS